MSILSIFICVFIYVILYLYLYRLLGILYLVIQIVPTLTNGSSFSWLLCSFAIYQLLWDLVIIIIIKYKSSVSPGTLSFLPNYNTVISMC